MAIDIVFPRDNEKALIDIAKQLGYSELCFVYSKDLDRKRVKVAALQKKTGIMLFIGSDRKEKADLAVVMAGADNRETIERAKTDLIFGLEATGKRDFAFSRNSGLNQVLCKLAKDKGVMIGLSFSDVLRSKSPQTVLGRMKQNITLCRKYKTGMVIASFAKDPFEMRSPHDLAAFFVCAGMDTNDAQKALEAASLKIRKNLEQRGKGYISEGVQVVE